MQGIYFYIAHVPFTAPQSEYPGLKLYLTEMNKYEPKYAQDEVAIQGWESAALFAQGVKMAGNNLTQANVINQTNTLTAFTAGGLTAPTNWTTRATPATRPRTARPTFRSKGTKYVPALNTRRRASSSASQSTNAKKPSP